MALANGKGRLWKKLAQVGVEVSSDSIFAQVAADGEDIPYGKPYVIFKEMSPGKFP